MSKVKKVVKGAIKIIEQKEKEAFGEAGNGRDILSSSEGVQLPLFSMWN